jgi:putative DNA-invertase from lambdoid prophage Rac
VVAFEPLAEAPSTRSLIVERVKAGLRNARAKGKRLGRPSKGVDAAIVGRLRSQGATWRAIANHLGIGLATLHRASVPRSKTREMDFGTR